MGCYPTGAGRKVGDPGASALTPGGAAGAAGLQRGPCRTGSQQTWLEAWALWPGSRCNCRAPKVQCAICPRPRRRHVRHDP
eukprot:10025647-Alexandrium_andersonii.AAC.1